MSEIGSAEHKAEFIAVMKKETAENIWRNELHIARLTDEMQLTQAQLEKRRAEVEAKNKAPANVEKKELFNLERIIEHKKKEIAEVEDTKTYNSYLLNDLLPRYEKQA